MGPKRKQANAAIKSPAKKKRVEKEKSAEATPETVTKSENKDLKDLKTPAAKLKIYEPPVPMEPFSFTAPLPTRHRKTHEFSFADSEVAVSNNFRPNVSPEEMLRRGVFGGAYFRPLYSAKMKLEYHDDWEDLPAEWYNGLDVAKMLTNSEPDPEVNCFKVKVGQSIEDWEKAGWIEHKYDVRGWFQWYCRFYNGRRCPDDERQIKRWAKLAGQKGGRWRRILLGKYVAARVNEVPPEEEENVSPGIRQTLLQWAFQVETDHLDLYKEEKGIRVPNHGESDEEARGAATDEDDKEEQSS